jgi:transcriptional regulator with XRE-family HTH domain
MDNKEVFNRAEFAALLDKAKGDRSINQYANETGVSAAHISRFLREMIEAPPTPETISKLATKAYNEVTYRDLMAAAGHINIATQPNEDTIRNSDIEIYSPLDRRRRMEDLQKRFFQVILSDLYTKPFKWSIQKPEDKPFSPDMVVDIDHDGYNRWYLDFKGTLDDGRSAGPHPYHFYGQITLVELLPSDKFTLVVNSETYYKQFLRRPPVSLRANLYVMLIDLDKGEVIKEEQLCKY